MLSAIKGAENLSGQIFFAVGADAPLRLFPRDDARLLSITIALQPTGRGAFPHVQR